MKQAARQRMGYINIYFFNVKELSLAFISCFILNVMHVFVVSAERIIHMNGKRGYEQSSRLVQAQAPQAVV